MTSNNNPMGTLVRRYGLDYILQLPAPEPYTNGEIPQDEFAAAAQSLDLWPAERRVIYCTVSGRPWAAVDNAFAAECCKHFGLQGAESLKSVAVRGALFSGPSPLWMSRTPETLARNIAIDPHGFLVYILNTFGKYEKRAGTDLEALARIRTEMVELWQALHSVPTATVREISQVLLVCSGEGRNLHVDQWASNLANYGSENNLRHLLGVAYHSRKHERKRERQLLQPTRMAHPVHFRTANKILDLETVDENLRQNVMDMIIHRIFAGTAAAALEAGTTKELTAELRRLANKPKAAPPKPTHAATFERGSVITLGRRK